VTDLATLRIVEIGAHPYVKNAFPERTQFFATYAGGTHVDPAEDKYNVALATAPRLVRALGQADLIVCQPTFYPPWHWRWLARCLFHRRILKGQFPLVSSTGPQFLRFAGRAPLAVLDLEDVPYIDPSRFFLLDRAQLYFKRELPPDRWRVFTRSGHAELPTPRFRKLPRFTARVAKLRPTSLGLPLDFVPAILPGEKTADVFFAGLVEGSSTIRAAGLRELLALRDRGVTVDIPEGRMPRDEFYARCARAWLTWSPEGLGWDCFRHYEAPACGSVPVINRATIARHAPLHDGEHAFFYDPEDGELTRTILGALADKPRLAAMADAARDHVLAHHTARALATRVVSETLAVAATLPPTSGPD
jgi:glycosyltransferase involved in cell wall biosynthesis